jgi:hypothetical protein
VQVGEPLEKIVMLFAVEREGKRWMDILSGPGGAKLELSKKVRTRATQQSFWYSNSNGSFGLAKAGSGQRNETKRRILLSFGIVCAG